MKEYTIDIVTQVTYSECIEANSFKEAETKARQMFNLGQLDHPIDEGIVAIDLVSED